MSKLNLDVKAMLGELCTVLLYPIDRKSSDIYEIVSVPLIR